MIGLLVVLAWLTVGFGLLAIGRYLGWWPWLVVIPEKAEPFPLTMGRKTIPEHVDNDIVWLWVVLWPFALLAGIGTAILRASDRARTNKLKLRAELEKELADARKQVEDLLRR